jgi:hypothetical protein
MSDWKEDDEEAIKEAADLVSLLLIVPLEKFTLDICFTSIMHTCASSDGGPGMNFG